MEMLSALEAQLVEFAEKRGLRSAHTPKNLAMALAGEVGELVAVLQWMSDAEIEKGLSGGELFDRLEDEVADVFIYLIYFAQRVGIDLISATQAKVVRNETRYPVSG